MRQPDSNGVKTFLEQNINPETENTCGLALNGFTGYLKDPVAKQGVGIQRRSHLGSNRSQSLTGSQARRFSLPLLDSSLLFVLITFLFYHCIFPELFLSIEKIKMYLSEGKSGISLVCCKPYFKSKEDWLQCTDCRKWEHSSCANNDSYFICLNCLSE